MTNRDLSKWVASHGRAHAAEPARCFCTNAVLDARVLPVVGSWRLPQKPLYPSLVIQMDAMSRVVTKVEVVRDVSLEPQRAVWQAARRGRGTPLRKASDASLFDVCPLIDES
jgi:hypothetical protein